jgi:hypothetical protein
MNGALPRPAPPPTVAQLVVTAPLAPGMTHSMQAVDEHSFTPPSARQEIRALGVVPRMFPSEPSTTDPNVQVLRDVPGSGVTEGSVPAAAVGFRPPQHADPSITAPRPMAPTDPEIPASGGVAPTLFDRGRIDSQRGQPYDPTRSGNLPVAQVPQAAIETQLSAPRTRVRSTLTVVVIILAVLCSITFAMLLAAIGKTYFGL